MIDYNHFATLAHGMSHADLCQRLGISERTLRSYRNGSQEPPKAAQELLKLINWGELSAIGGKDWEGFVLRRGELQIPFFHRTFTPWQIKAMFFETQDSWALRRDLEQAQMEIAALHGATAYQPNKLRQAHQQQPK